MLRFQFSEALRGLVQFLGRVGAGISCQRRRRVLPGFFHAGGNVGSSFCHPELLPSGLCCTGSQRRAPGRGWLIWHGTGINRLSRHFCMFPALVTPTLMLRCCLRLS